MLAATRTRTLRTIAIATLVASMMLGALLAPQQAEATYYYKYDKVKVYTGPYPFYGYMWATFRWDVTTVYYGQHYRCVNSIRITVTPSQQVGGFVFGPDTEFMARNFYVPNWYPAYYPNSGTKTIQPKLCYQPGTEAYVQAFLMPAGFDGVSLWGGGVNMSSMMTL